MLQCLNLDKDLYWNFTSYSILFKQSSLHIIFANVWPFNLFNLILNSCPYVCDQYSSDVSCCDIVYWPLAPNSVARFGPKVGQSGWPQKGQIQGSVFPDLIQYILARKKNPWICHISSSISRRGVSHFLGFFS